jgi:hypothetical protein
MLDAPGNRGSGRLSSQSASTSVEQGFNPGLTAFYDRHLFFAPCIGLLQFSPEALDGHFVAITLGHVTIHRRLDHSRPRLSVLRLLAISLHFKLQQVNLAQVITAFTLIARQQVGDRGSSNIICVRDCGHQIS